ncbi:MAG: Hsp70 family protein, partial [Myxococcales bacterium]|nr:Hsp70 family protein [Myxococcales bacterium]
TTIPLEKTKSFYTARENQSNVSIRIYQGESAKETDNQRLGSFSFSGLQPGDDGRGLVEVTFAVNADGILQISARDAVSGARRSARIDYTNRISEEEIQARLESPEDLDRIQF